MCCSGQRHRLRRHRLQVVSQSRRTMVAGSPTAQTVCNHQRHGDHHTPATSLHTDKVPADAPVRDHDYIRQHYQGVALCVCRRRRDARHHRLLNTALLEDRLQRFQYCKKRSTFHCIMWTGRLELHQFDEVSRSQPAASVVVFALDLLLFNSAVHTADGMMVIFNFVLFCGVRGVSVSTDAVTLDAAVDIAPRTWQSSTSRHSSAPELTSSARRVLSETVETLFMVTQQCVHKILRLQLSRLIGTLSIVNGSHTLSSLTKSATCCSMTSLRGEPREIIVVEVKSINTFNTYAHSQKSIAYDAEQDVQRPILWMCRGCSRVCC